jgi:hypothetical protein
MTLFQVGFLANEPLGGSEPNNSHELASAQPVPVSGPVQLSKPCAGGWGFALAIAAGADQVFSWGVNSATILAKAVSSCGMQQEIRPDQGLTSQK